VVLAGRIPRRCATQYGMLPSMATPPARRPATAADIVDERHEVVRGEFMRKASPSFQHASTQNAVGGVLFGFRGPARADRPGGWWLGTEAEIELDAHDVYLPDVAGWRIARVPNPPQGRPVRIPPDWVCEILSPSTTARDLGHKQRTYHRMHVRHYWIVDPIEQVLSVYRWQEDGYLLALVASPGELVRAEPFDAIELDVAALFDRPLGHPLGP
jgi:Uma2 family endonuclease